MVVKKIRFKDQVTLVFFFVMFYRFYHGKSAKKGKLPKNKKGPIMEYVEFPSTLSKSKVNRS